MIEFRTSGKTADKDLYDRLFFQHLHLNEITNNDEIILSFTDAINKILKKTEGYTLLTIDIKTKSYVILLIKAKLYSTAYNYCYIQVNDKAIDAGTSFNIEQESDSDLFKYLHENTNRRALNNIDIVNLIITKTLMGYRINKDKANDVLRNMTRYTNGNAFTSDSLKEIALVANDGIISAKQNVSGKFDKLITNLEIPIINRPDLSIIRKLIPTGGRIDRYNTSFISAFRMDKVVSVNNRRFTFISNLNLSTISNLSDNNDSTRFVNTSIATSASSDSQELFSKTDDYYILESRSSYNESIIGSLPYNYMDEGRIVLALGDGRNYRYTIVFQDPKVKELTGVKLEKAIASAIKDIVDRNIKIDECYLNVEENKSKLFLHRYSNSSSYYVGLKDMIKAIKSMANEYNYVVKKQNATGGDVRITDNILYSHETGKIAYNDFAIEVNSEQIKAALFKSSNEFMLKYFRKEVSEEQIIDQLSDFIYSKLEDIIKTSYSFKELTVTLNNAVNVKLEINKGDNNFTYINSTRVNKNEIVSILREISCYNSQVSADKLIQNICKKGLSVFIGLSSGFFTKDKYFKFKTTDRKNIYTMNIDGIDVDIKGKRLFNTLFSLTILDSRKNVRSSVSDDEYINNHVFNNVNSKFDYIKYKIMIDKSYKLFIDKSKTFLEKKVTDLNAEFVKYNDHNTGTIYDAIKVTGSSGKEYIIAYTLKESFVFMTPELEDVVDDAVDDVENDVTHYTKGVYICMIDQSKMKATVGYDTVVSKLLSLKNDSVIASTIYNLEDELKK